MSAEQEADGLSDLADAQQQPDGQEQQLLPDRSKRRYSVSAVSGAEHDDFLLMIEQEEAEAQEAASDTILVGCPEGVSAGDLLYVQTPDGREVSVEVPDGIGPGDEFEVYVGEEEGIEEEAVEAVEEEEVRAAPVPPGTTI